MRHRRGRVAHIRQIREDQQKNTSLGPSWLLPQNIIDHVAYKQQKFVSHSPEAGRTNIKALEDLVLVKTSFLVHRWPSSSCVLTRWKGQGMLKGLFFKDTNPIHQGSALKTYSPPKGSIHLQYHHIGFWI